MSKISAKYNFVLIKSNKIYSYYDEEGVVSLKIIKSGWTDKYDCILEWGEYGNAEIYIYTSEEINKYYGICTFSRKEKLKKINESIL